MSTLNDNRLHADPGQGETQDPRRSRGPRPRCSATAR